ncbi:hypothetical protein F4777DRAFT_358777 [Nemania sp. FL0916]|nr:hypothetical protein F4777DRAFT_358777 [Nemania sp. FL0916]
MAQEFFHLNGNNGPMPGQGPRPGGPPHGHQHGHPGGAPHGQQQGFHQGHPGAHALPRNMNRGDFQGGPIPQISSVRRDLYSESDMKEELSEYMVVRFEKMPDNNRYDDDDGRPRSSWETALRFEDQSISKQAAAKKVRYLNQTTKDVISKKDSLPPELKWQIDKFLAEWMSQELVNSDYHWVLVQLDHQLKSMEIYFPGGWQYPSKSGKRHRSSSHHLLPKRRSRSASGSHHHHHSHHHMQPRKAYERLSLTAYFQRVPKEGVDIPRLWRETRSRLDGNFYPMGVNNQGFPPMQGAHNQFNHQHQHQGQHQGGQQQMRGPPPNQQGGPHQQQPQNRGPGGPPRPQQGGGGQGQGQGFRPNPNQNQNQGQRGRVQNLSDSDSDSDSRSTRSRSPVRQRRRSETPPSSVEGPRGGGGGGPFNKGPNNNNNTRGGPGLPPLGRPGGMNNNNINSRPGTGGGPQGQQRPLGGGPPHRPPPPPGAPHPVGFGDESMASHIERIREEAYRNGRIAERKDQIVAEDMAAYSGRLRPPMRGVRRGVDIDQMDRYLAGLRLHDHDDEYDDELVADRREDLLRRREFAERVQHGSVLEGDPFQNSVSASSADAYSLNDGITGGRGRRYSPPLGIGIPAHHRRSLSPLPVPLRRTPTYY